MWLPRGLLIVVTAVAFCVLGLCAALPGVASAQSGTPPERGKQGWPCADYTDCAPGFGCFKTGAPYYIAYCTVPPTGGQPAGEPGGPGVPAKTCQTASDCGPGDWQCSAGICSYGGEKRCTSDADCQGGWACKVIGNGHACMPP